MTARRGWARRIAGGPVSRAMRDLNARHPWSHNDHFHAWVTTRLPRRRRCALDVGCGRGELVATLASRFERVHGIDVDPGMYRASAARCAGLPHVTVECATLSDTTWGEPVDLVTMIAVLHHLDVPSTLLDVRRRLAPGGRFLAVGLAPPVSVRDHVWDLASALTNPVIGYVKHPWPSGDGPPPDPFPVTEPTLPFDTVAGLVAEVMPGAVMRHQLGFRHTIEWQAP